jgi:uncharacterized protein
MTKVTAFLCGLIFGLGLVVAQMSNPEKVLNFLDLTGRWDPSLAFVMGGAVLVAFLGFRHLDFKRDSRQKPAATFPPAPRQAPILADARLIGGAALFGIGWGLVGFCPGPAIVALGRGSWEAALFVVAMVAGMGLYDRVLRPNLQLDDLAGDCTTPQDDCGSGAPVSPLR